MGDKTVPCWRDGLTMQCYAIAEQDLNLWADLHVSTATLCTIETRISTSFQIKNPSEYPIDKKPPQLNLFHSVRNAQLTQEKQQQQMMSNPFTMPFGGSFFPPTFMAPWQMQAMMMGQGNPNPLMPGFAPPESNTHNNPTGQLGGPSQQTALSTKSNIVFPDVSEWVVYCDRHPQWSRARIGDLSAKLDKQGYLWIDQLTSDQVSQSNLAEYLSIGLGTAALIIKYADDDMACVRERTFNMDLA